MQYRTWPPMLKELYRASSSRCVTDLCTFAKIGHHCGRHWDVSILSEDGVTINPMNIQGSLRFKHGSLGGDNNLNWHTSILLTSYSQVNL